LKGTWLRRRARNDDGRADAVFVIGEALVVAAAFLILAICGSAHAEEPLGPLTFSPWDIEQHKTGYVAVTRADDHRSAILIFCTLIGTRNIVYAYDGRGQPSEDIPISQVRVLATPTIEVLGQALPSSTASFANDGFIVRMQLPLPADFEPPQSGEMSLSSGPEATPENRWSVRIGIEGLDDSLKIAFQNCV
jgi:hypothetical protein